MEDDRRIEPSLEQWRELYALADRIKAMAPWTWMEEDDLFGVESPAFGETAFVSVMGARREQHSVVVYQGTRGLAGFWMLHNDADHAGMDEIVLTTPHLQLQFQDRGMLTDRDRSIIGQLGLKYRGKQAWPRFRATRRGYLPWYLDAEDATQMQIALEQTLEVAPRIGQDPGILMQDTPNSYLVRRGEQDSGPWQDTQRALTPEPGSEVRIAMRLDILQAYRTMPTKPITVQVDLYAGRGQIGERGKRPYPAWTLLVVKAANGSIIGSRLLEPSPSVEAMLGEVPLTLLRVLLGLGAQPDVIEVSRPLVLQLLSGIARDAGWSLRVRSPLWPLTEVREQIDAFLTR